MSRDTSQQQQRGQQELAKIARTQIAFKIGGLTEQNFDYAEQEIQAVRSPPPPPPTLLPLSVKVIDVDVCSSCANLRLISTSSCSNDSSLLHSSHLASLPLPHPTPTPLLPSVSHPHHHLQPNRLSLSNSSLQRSGSWPETLLRHLGSPKL